MKNVNLDVCKIIKNIEECSDANKSSGKVSVSGSSDKEDVRLYELTEEGVYGFFSIMNHNKKSHNNLFDLAKVISDAYFVSPCLANKMWDELWQENKLLKGSQKRYFIHVIFSNLLNLLGINDAVELVLMQSDRLRLILEKDDYGSVKGIKYICQYYLEKNNYDKVIFICSLWQEINNINDTISVNNEWLCSEIYSIIDPANNNSGQLRPGEGLENKNGIDLVSVIGFCNFLEQFFPYPRYII